MIKKRESVLGTFGRKEQQDQWLARRGATEHPCGNLEETAASAPRRKPGGRKRRECVDLACRGRAASGV